MSFVITTDSASNLPTSLLRKHDIKMIPLSYVVNGVEYFNSDQDSFDGKAYFDLMREKTTVTTSLINPEAFIQFFEPFLQVGNDILYIGLSSGVSGTLHSAQLAANELQATYPDRKLIIIDSLGASLGAGMQVLKAARLRDNGHSLESIAEIIITERMNMNQVLIVGNLMHLHRTGRVSGVTAIIGSTLKINALLKGSSEGKIVACGKTIGRRRALKALAEMYEKKHDPNKKQLVCIAHCDCIDDAQYLADLIKQTDEPDELLIVCYDPVTGSHVGPDTVALFFEGDFR